MSVVSLNETKLHLRVTQSTEDTLIETYIEAAEDYISRFLNNTNFQVTPSIRAAALLIVSDFYENRMGAGDKDIKENPAVMRLLYPYREGIGI